MTNLLGTPNSDFIPGTPSDDVIQGLAGDDFIPALQGNDLSLGNQGADTLYGGQGNDTLLGGRENDLLIGDLGTDFLSGDAGSDLFVITRRAGVATVGETDIIADFGNGRDRLLLLEGLKFDDFNVLTQGGNLILQDRLTSQFLAVLPGVTQLTNSDVVSLIGGLESGQVLPIEATTNISGQTLEIEVAQTPQEQSLGLMGRTDLGDHQGMLFPINPPRPVQFWMKDTLIPLDIIFLQNGIIQDIVANAPPCQTEPCPLYGPLNFNTDQVLEVPGGRGAELNLQVGDQINFFFS